MRLTTLLAAAGAAAVLALTACSPAAPTDTTGPGGVTTVTVRLWDDQVATAYRQSFDAFQQQHPDIKVTLNLVPFKNYATTLPLDVSSGTVDDVYWTNATTFGAFADAGKLIDVGKELSADVPGYVPAAVKQYTRNGTLWGVPAVTDGRIALFYNKAMVAAAGVDPAKLTWNPTDAAADTFLPAARKLTKDKAGATADQPGFDPTAVTQYGFNAAQDLQAIMYEFIGSAGGSLQAPDDTFTFTDPKTEQAFTYMVGLINTAHVAPSAADTNDNGDFSRDQFIQGKMALFQSGTYNLKNISDGATFGWGIAPMIAGPAGRVSVVNSVVAVGNAASPRHDAILQVLHWLGSPEGAKYVGAQGAALPAVTAAQQTYYDYWKSKGVDTTNFGDASGTATTGTPSGPKFGAASSAYQPILNEVFAGRTAVGPGLAQAQDAANTAIK
jgi:multiple sugar transport system substrate-binding protein